MQDLVLKVERERELRFKGVNLLEALLRELSVQTLYPLKENRCNYATLGPSTARWRCAVGSPLPKKKDLKQAGNVLDSQVIRVEPYVRWKLLCAKLLSLGLIPSAVN